MRKRLRNVWAAAENWVPVACLLVGARYEFKRCLSFHESKEVRRGKGDMVSSTILGSKVFEVFWSHDRKILRNPWLVLLLLSAKLTLRPTLDQKRIANVPRYQRDNNGIPI